MDQQTPHSQTFGDSSGQFAANASSSNFFGRKTGYYATNANDSNFLGYYSDGMQRMHRILTFWTIIRTICFQRLILKSLWVSSRYDFHWK